MTPLEGKITILISKDTTSIEIIDSQSSTTFLKVILTAEQLSMALSRQARVECQLEIDKLERVGKIHEHKIFEFEIPENLVSGAKEKELQELAQSKLSDGWIADGHFRSKNSFFTKDGVQYASCIIRRYV